MCRKFNGFFIIKQVIINIWKSYMCTAVKETNIESSLAVMKTTELVFEIRSEKNSGPYGIWTHDPCQTGAVLKKLS